MLIEKELISLDMVGDNKEDLIDSLIELAGQQGKLLDAAMYKEAVIKRESEFSTAIGYLVAIPHGQSDGVKEPFVVFGRCANEVMWGDNEVKLIFMIGVPLANRDTTHMKILANISRKLISEEFRESLLNAGSEEAIFEILSAITI